jgi:hypothetical protein
MTRLELWSESVGGRQDGGGSAHALDLFNVGGRQETVVRSNSTL